MTKLSALTVCVGRAHALRLTLPHNVKQVDELIVVTTEDDVETQRVLGENTKATTVISNVCYDNGDTFNLGRMQNEGLKRLGADADWLVFFCCDVFLNRRLRDFVQRQKLDTDFLYGSYQYDSTAEHAAVFVDTVPHPEVGGLPTGVRAEPNGYFQLWNRLTHYLPRPWPAVMSEAFCSAGGPDTWFAQQWPVDKIRIVPDLAVVHILHDDTRIGAGWNNGPARGPCWRQCGMISPYGVYIPTEDLPAGPVRLRLTETRGGESVEAVAEDGQFPPHVISANGNNGLMFKGRDIGDQQHVHVAYYHEPR